MNRGSTHDFKTVVVIPAGRKEYLKILIGYLIRDRHLIDRVYFWINTTNQQDMDFMADVVSRWPNFFFAQHIPEKKEYAFSIYHFYKFCIDPDTIYIRLDDDICYVSPDAIKNLLEFRIAHPQFFLIYPCIINNSMNSYTIETWKKNGISNLPDFSDHWLDDPEYIKQLHTCFLTNIYNVDIFKIHSHSISAANVNCICWFGKDFQLFDGIIHREEERDLAVVKPQLLNRQNAVCGQALMTHFAFEQQRPSLQQTNILARYHEIINPRKFY